MKSRVSVVRCNNYAPLLVLEATRRAIDLAGGISAFIKPKSKVLVKPNLLMAKGPEFGIDTHPEVVRAAVKILKEINCRVFLGDGPSVWGRQAENVDMVYEKSGMKRIAEEEGAELVRFDKRCWKGKFPLTQWVDDCDCILSVPKLKTHDLMTLTGAIKNLFGLVSGIYKTELHRRYFDVKDFASILVDIYEQTRPALTVCDGIVAMEGDGPGTSGRLRNLGLLFASSDCVALDSILALVMGLEPQDILTTEEAARRGLGVADVNCIEILGARLEDIMLEPFQLPTTSIKKKIPRPVIDIARKLVRFYPRVERKNCILCQACIAACPNGAISMKSDRIVIDYAKCISCFCCQEACPAAAIKVKKGILAKAMGL